MRGTAHPFGKRTTCRFGVNGSTLVLYSSGRGSIPRSGSILRERETLKTKLTIAFTRELIDSIEFGKCVVTVDDPNDAKEIQRKLASGDFDQFLITKRSSGDYDWDWEVVKEEDARA